MMIRSNGSSNIMGAAIVPTIELINAVLNPCFRVITIIIIKVTNADIYVTGLIGLAGSV